MIRLLVLVLLTAGGCATAPPVPERYLLRPTLEASGEARAQQPRAALGSITVAPYLDQLGIVVETGDQRIVTARDHLWAEPLQDAVRRLLQVAIGRAWGHPVAARPAGTTVPVVDVQIHRFHGSVEAPVILAAEWQVRSDTGDGTVERREIALSARPEAPGYGALVRAHADLLERLAAAIAQSLGRSGAKGGGGRGGRSLD